MLRTEEMRPAEWQGITADSCDLATIALPLPKSDWIHRAQEVTTIDDSGISRTSREVAALYGRSTGLILTSTRSDFHTACDACVRMLSSSHLKPRPYSVRRGGTTRRYSTLCLKGALGGQPNGPGVCNEWAARQQHYCRSSTGAHR